MRKLSINACYALIVLSLFASLGFGQATAGALVGTVYDPANAPVADVRVELQNVATGVTYSTITGPQGQYRFDNVPVGTYKMTAGAPRFATVTMQNVAVELNRTATVNVNLAVGPVTQAIDLVAAPPIDSTNSWILTNYQTRLAQDAPQSVFMPQPVFAGKPEGEIWGSYNNSLYNAGVTQAGGIGTGFGPSVGGMRPTFNNFEIEGMDNNNHLTTGPMIYLPANGTQSFTLLQNVYSPQWGHGMAGQFNSVTRSGSNEFHGGIYNYFHNRNMNAMDQSFVRQGILENPRFDRNQLGGRIGGPILRDKLFFFGNFEYLPSRQRIAPNGLVLGPTADGFAALAGIPGVSATNLGVLQSIVPAATTTTQFEQVNGSAIPVGPVPTTPYTQSDNYYGVGTMDWAISPASQLRFRYIHNETDGFGGQAQFEPFMSDYDRRAQLATVQHYHVFRPNLLNELRFGYSRWRFDNPGTSPSFGGLDAFPVLHVQSLGLRLGADPNAPTSQRFNTYHLVDNFNLIAGRHNFRFGYDGRRLINPIRFLEDARGFYEYTDLARFATDLSPNVTARRGFGDDHFSGNQWRHMLYVNDEIRVTPNFSATLGVSWYYETFPRTIEDQTLNSIANVPGVLTFDRPDKQRMWSPRVGIAYSPGTTGRTAIRAGFGLNWNFLNQDLFVRSVPPQVNTLIWADPTVNTADFLAGGGIAAPAAADTPDAARAATSRWLPHDLKHPYSLNWTLSLQHTFSNSWAFEARYMGTRGLNLPLERFLNQNARVFPGGGLPTFFAAPSQAELDALPTTLDDLLATPNNSFAPVGFTNPIRTFQPTAQSWYHGIHGQMNKRYSSGLQLIAAYTFTRNTDFAVDPLRGGRLTPRRPMYNEDWNSEYSNSSWDARHRGTITGLYETPTPALAPAWARFILGGWTLGGSYILQSGQWTTPQSGFDSNLNGDALPDRTIINPGGTNDIGSGVSPLFNTGGAVVGYLADNPGARYIQAGAGTAPNAGRNTLRTPHLNNFDAHVSKNFAFTENVGLRVGANAYNVFNNPQYFPGVINDINGQQVQLQRHFLIPGSGLFSDFSQAFPSHARMLQVFAQINF